MSRFVTMLLSLILLVPVTAGVAAGKQSGFQTRSAACAALAPTLLPSDTVWTADEAATYTGCALSVTGDWFWPSTGSDPLLAEKVTFTAAEQAIIDPMIKQLQREIQDFYVFIDHIEVAVGVSILDSISHSGTITCSYGLGGYDENLMNAYADAFTMVIDWPDYAVVVGYAVWWSTERARSQPDGQDNLPGLWGQAMDAMNAQMFYTRPPWPFELVRDYNQERFFRYLFDTGLLVA